MLNINQIKFLAKKYSQKNLFSSLLIIFIFYAQNCLAMEAEKQLSFVQLQKKIQLPLHRVFSLLFLQRIKDKSANTNFRTLEIKNYTQKYLEILQELCIDNDKLLGSKIDKSNYQNSLKNNLVKLADSPIVKNESIRNWITQRLTDISDDAFVEIATKLDRVFTLASSSTESTLSDLRSFINQSQQNKDLTNIVFFCFCVFVRTAIDEGWFKNLLTSFLKAGVTINFRYFGKLRTPLLEIILNGQRGVGAILLLKKNIDESYKEEWKKQVKNQTNNKPENIRRNKKYSKKETLTLRKSYTDIVNLFLENGANAELEDFENRNALIQATELGIFDIIKLLVEGYKVNIEKKDKTRNTALLIAVNQASNQSDKEIIEFLLKNNANPTAENSLKMSPLKIVAIRSNNKSNFNETIDFGIAKVLLEYIVKKNSSELVQQILESARRLSNNQYLFDLLFDAENSAQMKNTEM